MSRPSAARASALPPAEAASAKLFAEDVARSLTRRQRQLPSQYLYDALGSALFDAICRLPWYRVTRAETALLERHGADILGAVAPVTDIVELGPGSGQKLASLLRARPDAGPDAGAALRVHLVDVSRAALAGAAGLLSGLGDVQVVTHQASYEAGLTGVARERSSTGCTLVLFLGSNIGNFDPPGSDALLRQIRASLRPGDALLLGTDLVKPERDLLLAYDDPLGVTAAFNRNLLVRINRELGGTFDLGSFRHQAVWDAAASRIEMHLVSTRLQRIRIPGAGLEFTMQDGETIWTESAHKYTLDGVRMMIESAGFRCREAWVDSGAGFALTLAGP